MKKSDKSDIIIPIYNAYNCLSECIDSVIENTDLENNGLIIINDKSTDKRVVKLLKEYKKKYPFIKLLENKENLGFVKTANRGMRLSKNDVLLLNSDTIVTPRWLEKIKECAYGNEMVATVTPLSNNATLASVPNIFEKNNLPKDLSLNEMSKLVEECSYKDYPEIPTAHGFCMFIKRSVLEEVGYFDEESFGKGYGEENDFCFRCFNHGYRHLLCDDTYIYHKESQSFSKKKYELMENGRKMLEQRYPQYLGKLDNWNSERPIKYIGQNIAFELGKREKKKNILVLIHDWRDAKNNVGGTTLHVYDLIRNLRNDYNFHVLAPEDGLYKLYSYWSKTESEIIFPGVIDFGGRPLYNAQYKEILRKVVEDFNIEIVHIHHMIDHYFDIVDILKQFTLKSVLSIHDLYSLSPCFDKVQEKVNSSPLSLTRTEKKKITSLEDEEGYSKKNWNRVWRRLFENVDYVVTPSFSAKEQIEEVYRGLDISVIEHGVDLEKKETDLSIDGSGIVDIAFVGIIVKHKGSEILQYLVKKNRLNNVRIHLFGVTDLPLNEYKYFVNHGKYSRKDLPKLLQKNNIKLVCLFSLIPETYCYTLTESVAAGVPVLGTDIGALGERIRRDNLGWLINPDAEYEEFAEKINSILSNNKEYREVIKNLNKYKTRTAKEMGKDYKSIYRKLERKEIGVDYNYDSNAIKVLIKDSSLYTSSRVSKKNPDYSWIFGTFKWKMFEKLKIPRWIKRLYSKIRK